jgi:hypothetical protein
MSRRRLRPLPLAALVLAASLASPAPAATQTRYIIQLAPGVCGANNPANDVSLRRLPTGLKNAGTSTVSVVCTLWGDDGTAAAATNVRVFFSNGKPTAATITCTLHMGLPVTFQTTSTKSANVAGYSSNNQLSWGTTDYGSDANAQWATLQCSLPPGFTLAEFNVNYEENVGS